MVKEGIGGVFGKPKPLQTTLKTSDRLEQDACTMEARLMELRVTMQEEKKKREAALPLKHAGNRWRSARADRGSVRQYARDVEQKTLNKKQTAKVGTKKASKSSSREKIPILSPATVKQWTVPCVLAWLKAIGLEEYQSGFEFHQVTGKRLLKLSLEGYEKLGVCSVSARNQLLAEMKKVRTCQVKKGTTGSSPIEAAEIIDIKLRDPHVVSGPSKLASKMHWSQITPITDNINVSGDNQVPVNCADEESKEEAGHVSFLKDLFEWREDDAKQPEMSNQEQGEWVNPMFSGRSKDNNGGALLKGAYNEVEAHNSFQEALQAWRSGIRTAITPLLTPVEQTESGCTPGARQSCWQCYRIVRVEELLHDELTDKLFCGPTCQEKFRVQYARYYVRSS